ncbi:MAG: hypothetical protein DMG96_38455 [Acidobacteria bacterium]|nr:MAG: hypothetical protein DMG96_38455 [Acidobacteriota bacterium]
MAVFWSFDSPLSFFFSTIASLFAVQGVIERGCTFLEGFTSGSALYSTRRIYRIKGAVSEAISQRTLLFERTILMIRAGFLDRTRQTQLSPLSPEHAHRSVANRSQDQRVWRTRKGSDFCECL